MPRISDFVRDQRGAVNVDWVTLTSSVLLLGMAALYIIYGSGVLSVVTEVNGTLKDHGSDIQFGPPSELTDG